jgi:hypothetical protein
MKRAQRSTSVANGFGLAAMLFLSIYETVEPSRSCVGVHHPSK